MEKRNGCVDKKRVAREETANNPVGGLIKGSTEDDEEKRFALVEGDFKQDRDQPEEQSRRKENSCFVVLLIGCICHFCQLYRRGVEGDSVVWTGW